VDNHQPDAESQRLEEDARRTKNWTRWGPYLAERQWGTVREDYSANGDAWGYFPHDHARSRAYRWGEDGLLGITDRECRLCFALALWNGKDPILKERLFGLTNGEGNHGEDVKECYFYLDATPTNSYLKGLYKYPQPEFPYAQLLEENRRRSRQEPEFELLDTRIFADNRYFDVLAEYAKSSPNDVLIRLTVHNRGPDPARLHLLPTLWFRNTWSFNPRHEGVRTRPRLKQVGAGLIQADHETLGRFFLAVASGPGGEAPPLLFTENETNLQRLFAVPGGPFVKDAFYDYLIHGRKAAVNPAREGSKAAACYALEVAPGGSAVLRLRLYAEDETPAQPFGDDFERVLGARIQEADAFYARRIPGALSAEEQRISRQAYAGLLWSRQFYQYIVRDWLEGDPGLPPPPESRWAGRNRDWTHLYCNNIISMPDKWEYPWFAAWDLAFQVVALARVDPHFAKEQLILFLREWYTHPSGHLPAYEYGFEDVNPPVHAWACWRVYKLTGRHGQRDRVFLARVFHKLLINFTWWINRKDPSGNNLFAGGFLGLDNIGVFDRSHPPAGNLTLAQADGTAWMAFFCVTMLAMALELAHKEPGYEDVASKFFEHFVAISDAMNTLGGTGLWDEQDGFYYDAATTPDHSLRLRTRSMVGLIPLYAVEILEDDVLDCLPGFRKRLRWFVENRQDLAQHVAYMECQAGQGRGRRLLAIPSRQRLERMLRYLLDENEFLSPFGIRALSRYHKDHPYILPTDGSELRVEYEPGESSTAMFGGNSNWRGPIWFPVNFLLVEALQRYHHFYGDTLQVECPTGSGRRMNLLEVASEIATRLTRLFLPDGQGRRPCHGADSVYTQDPHWRDLVLFYEYFHGDTGRGCGASHQTGWTALITGLLHKFCVLCPPEHAALDESDRMRSKESAKSG
jgi:hypothetical protein